MKSVIKKVRDIFLENIYRYSESEKSKRFFDALKTAIDTIIDIRNPIRNRISTHMESDSKEASMSDDEWKEEIGKELIRLGLAPRVLYVEKGVVTWFYVNIDINRGITHHNPEAIYNALEPLPNQAGPDKAWAALQCFSVNMDLQPPLPPTGSVYHDGSPVHQSIVYSSESTPPAEYGISGNDGKKGKKEK